MSIQTIREELATGRLTITPLDDGSGVVLDRRGEQLLSMNASGLAIIQAIADGLQDENEIAAHLLLKFDVESPQALIDVRDFTNRLVKAL